MRAREKAERAWKTLSHCRTMRVPTGRDDLQPEDVGIHLMRRGKTIATADLGRDYGLYMGQWEGEWLVGIKGIEWTFGLPMTFLGTETFPTFEDLAGEWEVD